MAEWEKIAEQSKLTRNYNKLDNMRSYYFLTLADMVDEYIDEMYSIYNTKLFHYETTDDYYRGRLEDVYDMYTSLKERISDFMDKALSVTEAFIKSALVPIILVGVSFAFPPVGIAIAGITTVGCGVVAVIPDKVLPNFLERVKDSVTKRVIMLFTEGPQAVIEDIGQDFMDGIQTPEGIAAYAGQAFGTLAGVKCGKTHRIKKNKNPDVDGLKAPKDVDDVKPDVKKKDADVGKVDTLSTPNSRKLRQNMIKAGVEVPDYPNAAHHIVAGKSPKVAEARAILQKYGVDINDASNGTFLPTVKGVAKGAYHPSLHTDSYYRKVTELLSSAKSKDDVLDILEDIAEQLQNGTF